MKFERGPLMSWTEIFMADADERNAETRKAAKHTAVSLPDLYCVKYERFGIVWGGIVKADIDDDPTDHLARKFVGEIYRDGKLMATLSVNGGKVKTKNAILGAIKALALKCERRLRRAARKESK